MRVPDVRYVHSERGAIAYQWFGEGDIDILLLTPWIQSLDAAWDAAIDLRMWEYFSALGRVIMLDHRGLGSSDPLPLDRIGNLDEMTFDLLALLASLEVDKVAVVTLGNSAYRGVRLALDAPEAVERLVLINPRSYGGNAPRNVSIENSAQELRQHWGDGSLEVNRFRSNLEPSFTARHQRLAASPGVAAAMMLAMARTDMRPMLPLIAAPTMVIFTGDVTTLSVEESAAVATAIPGARFVEAESSSFYWGTWTEEMASFLTGRPWNQGQRDLVAVAFTDVVGSTECASAVGDREWKRILTFLDGTVERQVGRGGGAVVKQTGDGHLLAFPRPSDALEVVSRIVRDAPAIGVHMRAGIHFAEVERRPNGDLGGLGVHISARVAGLADPDTVFVTRTVAEIAAGAGWSFADQGERELKGVPGRWQLLLAER